MRPRVRPFDVQVRVELAGKILHLSPAVAVAVAMELYEAACEASKLALRREAAASSLEGESWSKP